jgi:hypothetical protein
MVGSLVFSDASSVSLNASQGIPLVVSSCVNISGANLTVTLGAEMAKQSGGEIPIASSSCFIVPQFTHHSTLQGGLLFNS